ncbi:hypothetical protein T484DRAFT_2904385 [Baffinella frigidus]|nr:hypothetical protein T484DRAFT_2904385 [Cryptophyta sp. CCMP2293]
MITLCGEASCICNLEGVGLHDCPPAPELPPGFAPLVRREDGQLVFVWVHQGKAVLDGEETIRELWAQHGPAIAAAAADADDEGLEMDSDVFEDTFRFFRIKVGELAAHQERVRAEIGAVASAGAAAAAVLRDQSDTTGSIPSQLPPLANLADDKTFPVDASGSELGAPSAKDARPPPPHAAASPRWKSSDAGAASRLPKRVGAELEGPMESGWKRRKQLQLLGLERKRPTQYEPHEPRGGQRQARVSPEKSAGAAGEEGDAPRSGRSGAVAAGSTATASPGVGLRTVAGAGSIIEVKFGKRWFRGWLVRFVKRTRCWVAKFDDGEVLSDIRLTEPDVRVVLPRADPKSQRPQLKPESESESEPERAAPPASSAQAARRGPSVPPVQRHDSTEAPVIVKKRLGRPPNWSKGLPGGAGRHPVGGGGWAGHVRKVPAGTAQHVEPVLVRPAVTGRWAGHVSATDIHQVVPTGRAQSVEAGAEEGGEEGGAVRPAVAGRWDVRKTGFVQKVVPDGKAEGDDGRKTGGRWAGHVKKADVQQDVPAEKAQSVEPEASETSSSSTPPVDTDASEAAAEERRAEEVVARMKPAAPVAAEGEAMVPMVCQHNASTALKRREQKTFGQILKCIGKRVYEVDANGHCLFLAVVHQMETSGEHYTVPSLRSSVADFMRLNAEILKGHLSADDFAQRIEDIECRHPRNHNPSTLKPNP